MDDQSVGKDRLRLMLDHFARVGDPREACKVKYPLGEVLFLVTCATIAGCDDYDEIADWGVDHCSDVRSHTASRSTGFRTFRLMNAQHQAELLAGEHRLVSAKDALLHALTGQWFTDPSTASGYGVYAPLSGNWDEELCAAAGIDPAILPHVAGPTAVAGALTAAWTDTGLPLALPVVVGAGDALAGVLGCGGAVPGTLAVISGTSTSMVVSVPRPRLDPASRFLLTPHALPDLWGLEMDLMATGSAIRWLSTMLGLPDPAALPALAAGAPPGAHGLLALPYLVGGEQGALWDATAPAAFVGLSLRHERADLARALLEGIAFEMRRCLLAWREQGVAIAEIVLTGSQGNETFTHLVAAVLACPSAWRRPYRHPRLARRCWLGQGPEPGTPRAYGPSRARR